MREKKEEKKKKAHLSLRHRSRIHAMLSVVVDFLGTVQLRVDRVKLALDLK